MAMERRKWAMRNFRAVFVSAPKEKVKREMMAALQQAEAMGSSKPASYTPA